MPRGKHQAKRKEESWITSKEIRNLGLISLILLFIAAIVGANSPTPNSVTGLPEAIAGGTQPSTQPNEIPTTTITPSRTPSTQTPPFSNKSETISDGTGHLLIASGQPSMLKTSAELPNSNLPMRQPTPTSMVDVPVTSTTRDEIPSGTTSTTIPQVVSSTTLPEPTTSYETTTTTIPSTATTAITPMTSRTNPSVTRPARPPEDN